MSWCQVCVSHTGVNIDCYTVLAWWLWGWKRVWNIVSVWLVFLAVWLVDLNRHGGSHYAHWHMDTLLCMLGSHNRWEFSSLLTVPLDNPGICLPIWLCDNENVKESSVMTKLEQERMSHTTPQDITGTAVSDNWYQIALPKDGVKWNGTKQKSPHSTWSIISMHVSRKAWSKSGKVPDFFNAVHCATSMGFSAQRN